MSRSHLPARCAGLAAMALAAGMAVALADEAELPSVTVAAPDQALEALMPLADALRQVVGDAGIATHTSIGSTGAGPGDAWRLRIVGPENVDAVGEEGIALARLTDEHHVVVVPMDSTVPSLADLMNIVRVQPDSVRWAMGDSDIDRQALEAVARASGADPAKLNVAPLEEASRRDAVIAGRVTVAFGPQSEFLEAFRHRNLRALAISAPSRIAGVDIPTFREQGFEVVTQTWRGVAIEGENASADAPAVRAAIGRLGETPDWQKLVDQHDRASSHRPANSFSDMPPGVP